MQPLNTLWPDRIGGRTAAFSPASLFANNEVGGWYDPSDLTTLFQDSAGTTPVTAAGQPVGLMLDKSKGLVLGSELWSDTGVIVGTGWTVASGVYTHTAGVDTFRKDIGLVAGKTYQVTFTVTGRTAGNIGPVYGGSVNGPTVTANGTYTQRVASGTNALLYFQPSTDFVGSVSGISVREIAGNHATQATAASRPTYGIHPITGVRNFANGSAAYDNSTFWSTSATNNGVTTARSGSGVDFDGLPYVDYSVIGTALLDTTSGAYLNSASRMSAASGQSFTSSFIARIVSGTVPPADNGIRADVIGETAPSTFIEASTSTVLAPTVDTLISVSRSLSSVTTNQARGVLSLVTRQGITVNYTIRIKALQFERSPTRTAYQANFNLFNITEAGVASVSYLGFDGVDDGMVTNTITPAIDKVQVFAGVRKLSDAAQGMFAELSSSATANNGAFFVVAPAANATADYAWRSKGTVAVTCISAATYVAPITNVMAGIGDISGDISTLRINSLHVETKTTDQGTGNYLAYPLYIGRRGGTTLPFNGRLYSLIVRFGPNLTDGQITSTENWINTNTGAY